MVVRSALRVLVANGGADERDAIVGALAGLPGVAVEIGDPCASTTTPADVVVIANAHARGAVEALRELRQVAAGAAEDLALYLQALGRLDTRRDADPSRLVAAASALANAIAAYVRGDAIARERVDLRALVPASVRVAELLVPDLSVAVDIAGGVRAILGHPTELVQMVVNLLLVARASSPARVELRVRLRADGDDCILEVSDTGRLARAVGGEPVAGSARGSLAIVRTVMQRHGAHMLIAPRQPIGTTIRVVLPGVR